MFKSYYCVGLIVYRSEIYYNINENYLCNFPYLLTKRNSYKFPVTLFLAINPLSSNLLQDKEVVATFLLLDRLQTKATVNVPIIILLYNDPSLALSLHFI